MEKSSYNVITGGAIPTRVGKVGLVDCDAAVCSLISPYLCDYRLKGVNMVPAAPVLATSDLPVQMYGAKSGHQLGYINKVCQVPSNATKSGIFPLFTADIPCAHGDSGALLITGRGATPPIPSWQAGYMSPAYIESMTCAMLGMLKAGPPPGADPNLRPEAYFTPMLEVFNDLQVEAWVR